MGNTELNADLNGPYWIAVAHLPKWTIERTNRLIVQVIHEQKMTWADLFGAGHSAWRSLFSLTDKEVNDLEQVKSDMPRLAFIAEQLQNEGFHIIRINSHEYPVVLKENLKLKNAPPVLYIKGRKGLLQEDAVAIVGSRKAGGSALAFTDHVAHKCVQEFKVVVSGFAKGVDKQALDSTLDANGKSIIVLPQGILTFQSGFRKYYEPIVNGDVLVLSTFFPSAGWDVGFDMTRNTYIYGLAKEIYVAESDETGGTWGGAIDGMKRGRQIYVRYPGPHEKNANRKLADLGATPVGMDGEPLLVPEPPELRFEEMLVKEVSEPAVALERIKHDPEEQILHFLSKGAYTAQAILLALRLDWDSRKLGAFLKKHHNVTTIAGKPSKFTRKEGITPTLFG